MSESQVLIAHAAPHSVESLMQILAECNCTLLIAHTVEEAQKVLSTEPVRMTFCEYELPVGGYSELLRWCQNRKILAPLIVSPKAADETGYVEAMTRGAFDYIVPPYRRVEVELLLRRHEMRVEMNVPVQVYGVDADGLPFLQDVRTRNVSQEGACIYGLAHRLETGAIIGVRHYEKGSHFRVVWIKQSTDRCFELGLQNLTPTNRILA